MGFFYAKSLADFEVGLCVQCCVRKKAKSLQRAKSKEW